MKIVVTGARGLLGWHAAARLHARNCAARFKGETPPFDLVLLDRAGFQDTGRLQSAVSDADAVLHFAGVNRAPDDEIECANPAIAEQLLAACREAGSSVHIVYANTIHAGRDTPYGRSKRRAGEMLAAFGPRYTDLVLPHIFGEGARPHYNNVTATLIDDLLQGRASSINPDGEVHLVHAGAAADAAIEAALNGSTGTIRPVARTIPVPDLYTLLRQIHDASRANIYPDLSESFVLQLFNCYRAAGYPESWPRALPLNCDPRGALFEAVKGGGGGQTFCSWTDPGITRGDHFHLHKVERFLVLQGDAVIRIRKVLGDQIWEYRVNGDAPAIVDMPVLHTHSIENTGESPLLTLFWTHQIFDPAAPDTYADPVLERAA